jgi:hypothetical protein
MGSGWNWRALIWSVFNLRALLPWIIIIIIIIIIIVIVIIIIKGDAVLIHRKRCRLVKSPVCGMSYGNAEVFRHPFAKAFIAYVLHYHSPKDKAGEEWC